MLSRWPREPWYGLPIPLEGPRRIRIPAPVRIKPSASFWHSLRYALNGLGYAWNTQRHLRWQILMGLTVILGGWWSGLSRDEWVWIGIAIGLVITAELINTVVESTVDLVVGPQWNAQAQRIKDLAAGCVLVTACLALVIGVCVFIPHAQRPVSL